MGIFTDALNDLEAAGFPSRSHSGLLGNMHVETGGSLDYQTQQKNGNGYGVFQFDSQKEPYFNYLKATGKPDSRLSQMEFAYDSIYNDTPFYEIGGGHQKELRRSFAEDSPEGISQEFMRRFERPGTPHAVRRFNTTKMYEGLLSP